uniref:Methyltransferase n=1 Tax=viral metagenome TaxID=1070528 RepID=A0A6C0JWY7_9ZZZZ
MNDIKIFLDFGTDDGKELLKYIDKFNMYTGWKILGFEFDPVKFERLKKEVVPEHSNLDVYDFIATDKIIKFDLSDKNESDWTPWSNNVALEKYRNIGRVKCFDVRMFLREFFFKSDHIVVRMNIAGAEYQLLEHLIQHDIIDYIDELYISFHSKNFDNKQDILRRESKILDTLIQKNVKYHVID